MSVTIIGLRTVDYTTKSETRFIAKFDVQIDGLLTLSDCALVMKGDRNHHVLGPDFEKGAVRFSKPLRRAICHQAMVAYQAMRDVQANSPRMEVSAAVALVQELEQRDAA